MMGGVFFICGGEGGGMTALNLTKKKIEGRNASITKKRNHPYLKTHPSKQILQEKF